MASSFKGWLDSWGGSWGPVVTDPNSMVGASGFALTATGAATAALFGSGSAALAVSASGDLTSGAAPSGDMVGLATLTFSAIGVLTDPNAFKYPDNFEQGVAGRNKPAKDYLSENLLRQQKARDRRATGKYNLQLDDTLATELIVALVTEGFFDGDF